MAEQICLNRRLCKHVGDAVADVDQDDTRVVPTDDKGHFVEVKARYFLHSPAAGLGGRRHRVSYTLSKLLLLVVDQDVFARVPDCGQKAAMVVLNYLVDELFGDVGDWVEVQRHHPCHLVLENLHEMHTSVGAHNHLISETGWLDLVDVADRLKFLSNTEIECTDREHVDKAVIFATDDLVFIDLSQ